MQETYIDPRWLDLAKGGVFFYPASGEDTQEPIDLFSDYAEEFHFCDIRYLDLQRLRPLLPVEPNQVYFEGPRAVDLNRNGRSTEVERGRRIEVYNRIDRAPLRIVRRRGFGQMGLTEFPDRSLRVFMHRGDSAGEGGSNAFFLSNTRKDYLPLSNLFSRLQDKLCNTALVVTDGSNTRKDFLKVYARIHPMVSGQEAYSAHQGKEYFYGSFHWQCVGWMSYRYGPTLIWGVSRLTSY